MAARAGRVPRRRLIDAGTAADRHLAGGVRHLPDPGLAGRRGRRRPVRRRDRGGERGLVVRLRIFPRRPLLGRQCVSGRCQDLRLAAAVRGGRLAGRDGGLHRARAGARPPHLDTRRNTRAGAGGGAHRRGMAARPSVQRLPVECLRLCAHLAVVAGAGRGAGRAVGHDVAGGGGLRQPGRARRRPRRYQTSMAGTGAERRGDRRACGLRRVASGEDAHDLCGRRPASHHAAQPAAGRKIQVFAKAAGDEPLPGAVRSRQRAAIDGRARRHPSDLAGIGISVLPRKARC